MRRRFRFLPPYVGSTLGVAELVEDHVVGLITCEGDGGVVGVRLRVHQDRGVEEVGEGQVEVEREEGRDQRETLMHEDGMK